MENGLNILTYITCFLFKWGWGVDVLVVWGFLSIGGRHGCFLSRWVFRCSRWNFTFFNRTLGLQWFGVQFGFAMVYDLICFVWCVSFVCNLSTKPC